MPTEYSVDFLKWSSFREAEEGGWSDLPGDTGGLTRYGISSAAHPGLNLDTLTRDGAQLIAHKEYWLGVHGDSLLWPLNIVMADWGFHSGPGSAFVGLRQELGLASTVPPVLAVAKALAVIDVTGADTLARNVHMRRVRKLYRIVQGNPSQLRFTGGWWNRTVRLAFLIGG